MVKEFSYLKIFIYVILYYKSLLSQEAFNLSDVQIGLERYNLRENSIFVFKQNQNYIFSQHNCIGEDNTRNVSVWFSTNKGQNWDLFDYPLEGYCDPSVTVDTKGFFYYSYLDDSYSLKVKRTFFLGNTVDISLDEKNVDKPYLWIDNYDRLLCSFKKNQEGFFVYRYFDKEGWVRIFHQQIYYEKSFIKGIRGTCDLSGNIFLIWNTDNEVFCSTKLLNNEYWITNSVAGPISLLNGETPIIAVNPFTNSVYVVFTSQDSKSGYSDILCYKSDDLGMSFGLSNLSDINYGNQNYPWITSAADNYGNNIVAIVYYDFNTYNRSVKVKFTLDDGYTTDTINLKNNIAGFPTEGHDYIAIDSYARNKEGKFYLHSVYSENIFINQRQFSRTKYSCFTVDYKYNNSRTLFKENFNVVAYPNPFNHNTKLIIKILNPGLLKIKLYNINGRFISQYENKYLVKGEYNYFINGNDLSTGIYFCCIDLNNSLETIKLFL